MPPKRRQVPETPPDDLSDLSDAEVAAVERTLRALDIAIRMGDRARRGEIDAPAEHFDEMVEVLLGDLALARRESHGDAPH
jgi:hypothetical protein